MLIPIEVDHDPHNAQEFPALTWLFLLAFIGVWIHTGMILDESARQEVFYRFGISRFEYRWWAFLSCTFLHLNFSHLLFNALFFWIYGASLEKLIGSGRFLLLYLVGAFLSVNLQVLTGSALDAYEPCIGASGAVSAVLGCFFVMLPHAKLRCLFFSPISFRPLMFLAPAWLVLGLWFGSQLLYTLGVMGTVANIAFWAHVAGFAAGALMGAVFDCRRQRQLQQWLARARAPLVSAWQEYLAGHLDAAAAKLEDPAVNHPEARPLRILLTAQLAAERQPELAGPALLRAFNQARDYQDYPLQMTLYLQMIRRLSPGDIPPITHRQAGFVALAEKQGQLALWAFVQSLRGGLTDRDEQMLRSLEALFTGQLANPDVAEAIRRLKSS